MPESPSHAEASSPAAPGDGGGDLRAALGAEVPGLLRFARTVAASETAAEDLVQETCLRALARGESFRAESSLATWLHRILHNLWVDGLRRDREVPDGDVLEEAERQWRDDAWTVDVATVAERTETRAQVRDALARLPYIYRGAVVLHDLEGMTSRQVAEVQQVGLPAAKQRLRRGRMMLVSALAEEPRRRDAQRGVPMRCWDARLLVSDYLDGELPAGDRELVEAHLSRCPTCPPLYAALLTTHAALRAMADPDSVVPPDVAERIRGRIRSAT